MHRSPNKNSIVLQGYLLWRNRFAARVRNSFTFQRIFCGILLFAFVGGMIGLPTPQHAASKEDSFEVWTFAATGGTTTSTCRCSSKLKDNGQCCCASKGGSTEGCCGQKKAITEPEAQCCSPKPKSIFADNVCGQIVQNQTCSTKSKQTTENSSQEESSKSQPAFTACGCGCEVNLSFLSCDDPRLVSDWSKYLNSAMIIETLLCSEQTQGCSLQAPELPPPEFA